MSVILLNDFLPTERLSPKFRNIPGYSGINPKELALLRSLNQINQLQRAINLKRINQERSNIGKDGFEVKLNVENFKPEEVTVQTVDNSIIVEAKSERKNENEYVSSHYRRRYELPSGFKCDDVSSTISSDGVLMIKCPRAAVEESSVREIEIQQTGPVRKQIEEGEQKSEEKGEKADRCRIF